MAWRHVGSPQAENLRALDAAPSTTAWVAGRRCQGTGRVRMRRRASTCRMGRQGSMLMYIIKKLWYIQFQSCPSSFPSPLPAKVGGQEEQCQDEWKIIAGGGACPVTICPQMGCDTCSGGFQQAYSRTPARGAGDPCTHAKLKKRNGQPQGPPEHCSVHGRTPAWLGDITKAGGLLPKRDYQSCSGNSLAVTSVREIFSRAKVDTRRKANEIIHPNLTAEPGWAGRWRALMTQPAVWRW